MISKIIVLCALFLVTGATYSYDTALENTGTSTSSSERDAYGNYAFSYEIVDNNGAGHTRSEVGDSHGNKKGSYSLHDVDGRARLVNYIADEHGFRVAISTNEPGTAKSEPAHAIIDSPYSLPQAPTAVTVVHEEPVAVVPISGSTKTSHVVAAPSAFPTKSVTSHGTKTVINHGTKSVTSHGTKTVHGAPAAIHKKPYAPVWILHSAPAAITKSAVSHASPFAFARAIPRSQTAKSVMSHALPISSQFTVVPHAGSKYSKLSGGLGHNFFRDHFGRFPIHSRMNHGMDVYGYNDHGLRYDKYFYNNGPYHFNI